MTGDDTIQEGANPHGQSTGATDRWELVAMFDGKQIFYRNRSVDTETELGGGSGR